MACSVERFLEEVSRKYARPEYLETDPLPIVRRYLRPEDREVVGLITALLAYGRVASIRRHVEEVLAPIGDSPAEFVRRFEPGLRATPFLPLRYRFHTGADLIRLLSAIGWVLREHGTIESLFVAEEGGTRERLSAFVRRLREAPVERRPWSESPGLRFLAPTPDDGGACKRWNLYLRWMARPDDGIDCGVWKHVSPAELIVPLDTHLHRIGRRLGLHAAGSPSWAAAERITDSLRAFDPLDPVRFDFPLCRLGILSRCPDSGFRTRCSGCELFERCVRVAQGSDENVR
ncbi:MAG: TIGR02757 family protein [Candidatus Latescibacterota bacterium]|nr:MAG: TIGR02757 family protein [Candidatus Latescibacterota bacterium]